MSHKAKWRVIPIEQIKQAVKESNSLFELARKLGYPSPGGGTIESLHRMIKEYNLDTSHFAGQGWRKEKYDYDTFTHFSFKKNGSTSALPLIKLRGRKCEKCGLETWLNQPINLEVHHIDGDRTNNSLDNLMLLCPNCHSYTPTFARSGEKREKTDEEFVQALKDSKSIRQALIHLDLTPAGDNYQRAWHLIYEYDIDHLKK
jgi:5-methylcytosine-specific restriction endonuclease McrA